MTDKRVQLINNKQYEKDSVLSRGKLIHAAESATDKLEKNLSRFTNKFASSATKNHVYDLMPNVDWVNGMQTGLFCLAYEITGNKCFMDAINVHLKSFQERFDSKTGLNSHDIGFLYVPSCVASYKLTGNEQARKLALDAAQYLYDFSFSKKGGFIIRVNGHNPNQYSDYRTMMDTLLNIPLFFWAYTETKKEYFRDAAIAQYKTTIKYLIRKDGSTFHHYQFNPSTDEPVKGVTWQGFSDDSCWSRGQAWGICGLPIAYSYTKDDAIIDVHRDITYYFLNKLPDDYIPYWDLIYTQGSKEPRDSSAGAIAVCGLNEMNKYLQKDSEQHKHYSNAAANILNSLIDKCNGAEEINCDGLLTHVTHALPQGIGIDESTVFGDYFYLEALMRFINPMWKRYW